MKNITLILLTLLTSLSLYGQNIVGQWNGTLSIQGAQLRVVFHIVKADNGYSSTMDSPDQGAKGIPVTSTRFENPVLTIEVSNADIEYTGTLVKKIILQEPLNNMGKLFR